MERYIPVLRRCPLFDQIEETHLLTMLRCLGASVHRFKRREIVQAEGSASRNVSIVLSGAVQLIQMDYEGNRSIVADIRTSGLFGESFAFAGEGILPLDIIAAENAEILQIDGTRIMTPCENACGFHSQLIRNLMHALAEMNLFYYQKLIITSRRTTRDKLMAYLYTQAKQSHSHTFTIPYNRQELADFLAVDRSGLSVEISRLCREGVIRADKKKFTLLDTAE